MTKNASVRSADATTLFNRLLTHTDIVRELCADGVAPTVLLQLNKASRKIVQQDAWHICADALDVPAVVLPPPQQVTTAVTPLGYCDILRLLDLGRRRRTALESMAATSPLRKQRFHLTMTAQWPAIYGQFALVVKQAEQHSPGRLCAAELLYPLLPFVLEHRLYRHPSSSSKTQLSFFDHQSPIGLDDVRRGFFAESAGLARLEIGRLAAARRTLFASAHPVLGHGVYMMEQRLEPLAGEKDEPLLGRLHCSPGRMAHAAPTRALVMPWDALAEEMGVNTAILCLLARVWQLEDADPFALPLASGRGLAVYLSYLGATWWSRPLMPLLNFIDRWIVFRWERRATKIHAELSSHLQGLFDDVWPGWLPAHPAASVQDNAASMTEGELLHLKEAAVSRALAWAALRGTTQTDRSGLQMVWPQSNHRRRRQNRVIIVPKVEPETINHMMSIFAFAYHNAAAYPDTLQRRLVRLLVPRPSGRARTEWQRLHLDLYRWAQPSPPLMAFDRFEAIHRA